MAQRIAYGFLTIAFLVSLFLLDALVAAHAYDLPSVVGDLLRRGSVMPLTFLVVLLMAAREMDHILRLRSAIPYTKFAYVMIALLLVCPWLSPTGILGESAQCLEGHYWQVVLMAVSVGGVGVVSVTRRRPDGILNDGAATLYMIGYLGLLGSFGVQIQCGSDIPQQTGIWFLCLVILVTKASDIGAYLIGTLCGRHKLVPAISPAKTWEGTIGGMIASALASIFLIRGIISQFGPLPIQEGVPPPEFALRNIPGLEKTATALLSVDAGSNIILAALFGLSLSLSGQFGDFVESSFKRDASVKDSGKIIPRYGGILDLVDSPVYAMPVGWFYLTVVWGIG